MSNSGTQIKENKMGIMPVNKLLLSMSLPMVLSMLVQALYNIVDSVFVAQVSEDALTAVSLAFPVQSFMIAVSTGTGVGINSLLSRSLGEKNFETANKTAGNGILLAFVSALLFAVFGSVFAGIFFHAQTQNEAIAGYGTQYLTICCSCSLGIFLQIVFERLLQSTGKTIYNMITQGVGAIINIILDPILIFGLFGLPRLEVAGAAIATVIGQIVAAGLGIYFNLKKNHEIKLAWKGLRPNGTIIKRIYIVGLPSIIMQSISSVMIFGMNKILLSFEDTAAAVFGVYFKLQSFIFMPLFGLTNGMIPIVAYNYGARHRERMIKTTKLSVVYAVGIMLFGVIMMQCFPAVFLRMFNASERMIALGVPALRIISLSFIFAGYGIICSSVFQALGNGVLSMLVSLIRQMAVLLPAAYLLSLTGDVNNIWFSFPIAEISSVVLCTVFLKHTYDKVIKPIPACGSLELTE